MPLPALLVGYPTVGNACRVGPPPQSHCRPQRTSGRVAVPSRLPTLTTGASVAAPMTPRDDSEAMLRETWWRISLLQAIAFVAGTIMAWQAVECALLRHNGHAIIWGIGVLISLFTYAIDARTRVHSKAVLVSRNPTAAGTDRKSLGE